MKPLQLWPWKEKIAQQGCLISCKTQLGTILSALILVGSVLYLVPGFMISISPSKNYLKALLSDSKFIALLRLEKTSLRSPSPTSTHLHHAHCATFPRFWNTSRDNDSTTFLHSLFQCITTFFWECIFFPNIKETFSESLLSQMYAECLYGFAWCRDGHNHRCSPYTFRFHFMLLEISLLFLLITLISTMTSPTLTELC